jgi:polyhydroxybutyrate depolymerase
VFNSIKSRGIIFQGLISMPRNKHFTRIGILIGSIFLLSLLGATAFRRIELQAPIPGDKSGTLEIGGSTRSFIVHIPNGYDGRTPVPLVLVLHGATQSPEGAEIMSGMSAKADKEGFLVVYPGGTGRISKIPTWNAGACCGYAMENHVDDVAFLSALIDKLELDYSVDSKRVFATGISNGGMMSYRLACDLAEKIAAIAPVEGAQDIACHPSAPVSVIVFHGTDDHLVAYDGGSTPFQIGPRRSDSSVADTVAFWVKEDGCAPAPRHEETTELHTDFYSACRDANAVELYAIQGGHHAWPGTRISGNSVPATEIIWAFFAKHPKP